MSSSIGLIKVDEAEGEINSERLFRNQIYHIFLVVLPVPGCLSLRSGESNDIFEGKCLSTMTSIILS